MINEIIKSKNKLEFIIAGPITYEIGRKRKKNFKVWSKIELIIIEIWFIKNKTKNKKNKN